MATYLHFCTKAAISRASLLLTDSQHAAQDIGKHSGLDEQKIVPVPLALTSDIQRVTDPDVLAAVRKQFTLTRPFVLADALKNPGTLVNAWRLLPAQLREQWQIVFFSRRPDVLPIVHEAVANGDARLLLRPSRPDLIALYSMADAFVFPSWIEGFGIPVLEAMTCGAPVIASNRGSIPEVAGDAALLADPRDVISFAQHIAMVLQDREEAPRLRERGFKQAAQFSWRKTARQILASYEMAAVAT